MKISQHSSVYVDLNIPYLHGGLENLIFLFLFFIFVKYNG